MRHLITLCLPVDFVNLLLLNELIKLFGLSKNILRRIWVYSITLPIRLKVFIFKLTSNLALYDSNCHS